MAFRGGRGRGRGFGGFQRHDIQLGDEERTSDVPSNYPPCETIPRKFDEQLSGQPEMQRLLKRYNALRQAHANSPFNIKQTQRDEQVGSVPDVQRQIDVVAPTAKRQPKQQPLSQVVFMHAKYLPEELYSAKDHKQSMQKRSTDFFRQHGHLQEESLELRLKELAAAEARAKLAGEDDAEPGAKQAGKKDDEDGEGQAEDEDDDDELDHEDDDYYQGENFDDDEEYGDNDDGGDNEPTY